MKNRVEYNNYINRKLNKYKKEQNLPSLRLSKLSGVPNSTCKNIIKEGHAPSTHNLMLLCRGLNLTVEQIMDLIVYQSE